MWIIVDEQPSLQGAEGQEAISNESLNAQNEEPFFGWPEVDDQQSTLGRSTSPHGGELSSISAGDDQQSTDEFSRHDGDNLSIVDSQHSTNESTSIVEDNWSTTDDDQQSSTSESSNSDETDHDLNGLREDQGQSSPGQAVNDQQPHESDRYFTGSDLEAQVMTAYIILGSERNFKGICFVLWV